MRGCIDVNAVLAQHQICSRVTQEGARNMYAVLGRHCVDADAGAADTETFSWRWTLDG